MVRVLTYLIAALLGTTLAFGQAQMSSGDIKGTVVDSSGARIAAATVTVTSIETGVERRMPSDDLGAYRFFALAPGPYAVRAEKEGFTIYTRRPVELTIGQSLDIELRLEPDKVKAEVLVQAPTPALEPDRTQQADTITAERINNLPINQRDFLSYSLLAPAVTDAGALISFGLPQTPTSGLSFLGQNGRSNCVTIDGVDNIDNASGAVRSTISQEAVREFQINRAGYSAEFGRCSGGSINIVSRSGTNRWGGTAFIFIRDQALDARNAFALGPGGVAIDPPFSRQQAGFTAGGPIVRDKTFGFLSYEALRRRESRFVSFLDNASFFSPTSGAAGHQQDVIAALAASGSTAFQNLAAALGPALTTSHATYPNTMRLLEANSGAFPYRSTDNTLSFRLDHTVSPANQAFARLSFTDSDTLGGSFGGLKGPSRGVNFQIQDHAAAFGDAHFWGSSKVNEFRFQAASRTFNTLAEDPFGPEITINGVAAVGRDFFLPSGRTERRFQWLDNVTLVLGNRVKHQLKFGGDFNYVRFDTLTEIFLGGRFIFGEAIPLRNILDAMGGAGTAANVEGSGVVPAAYLDEPIRSIQAFNFNLPLAYQQGFGDARAQFTNKIFSGFVQDSFSPTPRLTVNAGLRYDVELQPAPIHRDTNNFAPRLGFTYQLTPKTLVRGGYGVYYSQLVEAIAYIGRVLNNQQISQVFLPLSGLPAFGIPTTSANVWNYARANGLLGTRTITSTDLASLGVAPGSTPPVLFAADAGIVNPYSQQFSLGIDRELPGGMSLSVNYLGSRGVKLLRSRNVNVREVGTNAYGAVLGPIDPTVLQNNKVESSGSSSYHGMTVNVFKPFSRFAQFQVAYTLAKAIDDTTDFIVDLQPSNPLNLRGERGLSPFDQRHRFVASGVFRSPFERGMGVLSWFRELTLSPIFTAASGHPFNVILGFDANQDRNANTDRPAGLGRNAGQGPSYVSLNLRLSRSFRVSRANESRLEVMVESFNVLNRVNYSGINTAVGAAPLPAGPITGRRGVSPSDPLGFTSASDPRQVQLGLRLRY
jgi:hypothetical protein